MRKTIFGCLGAAAVAFALQFTTANVQAGLFERCTPCDEIANCNPCDEADSCDPCDAVDCGPKGGKWFFNGHLEAGFFANGHGAKNTYEMAHMGWSRGADPWSGNDILLQNTRLTGGQINQLYLSMGKSVDGRRGLDIGGTVDFTWGSDAYIVQANGLEYGTGHGANCPPGLKGVSSWGTGDYYSAFAQAYIELEYKRWNVKAGKFYAPFGIDSYKSTDNFFYSWSPTASFAPHTAGGAYATYTVNKNLAVFGGWAMPEELGESSKNNFFIGGFDWDLNKRLNLRYSFATGKNTYDPYDYKPYGYKGYKAFVQSLTATAQINKRLKYVFDWTLWNGNNQWEDWAGGNNYDAAYALMNEIIYQYNKKWAFGTRFGWLNEGDDWYTVSLGANWTPNKWLTLKPEIRYDWVKSDWGWAPFNNVVPGSEKTHQVSGGMSAVVKF